LIESVITQDGEHLVVTISPESMERYGLRVGDTIAFVPLRPEPQESLRSNVQDALDDVIRNDQDALEHLAGCDRDRSAPTA
jgi:hypothetical protein